MKRVSSKCLIRLGFCLTKYLINIRISLSRLKRTVEYLSIHNVLVKHQKDITRFVTVDWEIVPIEGSKGINNYRRVPAREHSTKWNQLNHQINIPGFSI